MSTDARTPARTPAPARVGHPDDPTPAELGIAVYTVYVHDSRSFCRMRLWASTDQHARRAAIQAAAKTGALLSYDSVHATASRSDAVLCQDAPEVIEFGQL